jgi:hypothetical protein
MEPQPTTAATKASSIGRAIRLPLGDLAELVVVVRLLLVGARLPRSSGRFKSPRACACFIHETILQVRRNGTGMNALDLVALVHLVGFVTRIGASVGRPRSIQLRFNLVM